MRIGLFEMVAGGAVLLAAVGVAFVFWYSSIMEDESKAIATKARLQAQRKLETEAKKAAERRPSVEKQQIPNPPAQPSPAVVGSEWTYLSCQPFSPAGMPSFDVAFRENTSEAILGDQSRSAQITKTSVTFVIARELGSMSIDRISGRYVGATDSGLCTPISKRNF